MSTLSDDELYQGYFEKVYQHTNVMSYSPEEAAQYAKQGVCLTYGELLYPSVKKLLGKMQLTKDDVFLDLGSGAGKCAFQVFMQSDVGKVLGIEASALLHQQALQVSLTLRKEFPWFWEDNRSCDFVEGNFLHSSWNQATVVYTCSTCFTQELLFAIADKINHTPSVQKVFSLRPLPGLRIPLESVFQVECSWDSALCFFYLR
ncbi:MAG: hypothetical protein JSR17_12290 [Proteobacteria bacterium]|nr:hypothetical protein [Pseudomonadota bacterium]